jgi:hypothetical protein
LGGAYNLNHIQLSLVERYTFLEFTLRAMETRIVKQLKKSDELIGRWVGWHASGKRKAKALPDKALTEKYYHIKDGRLNSHVSTRTPPLHRSC